MKRTFILAVLVAIAISTLHFVQAPITSTQQPGAHSRFLTNASVILVNNSGASNYRAVFMQNGNETTFLFPTWGSVTHSTVLPPGVYTLGVAPIGGASTNRTFSYSIGPDGGTQTGTSATFNNVNITSGSTITVSIN